MKDISLNCLLLTIYSVYSILFVDFRTIVLYEHSDVVVSAVVAALFTNRGGGPARVSCTWCPYQCMFVAIVILWMYRNSLVHGTNIIGRRILGRKIMILGNVIGLSKKKW